MWLLSKMGGMLACTGITPNAELIVERNRGGESGLVGETGDSDEATAGLDLCINEFMPDNHGALVADSGASYDWVELHNPGDSYVDMYGWSLTDEVGDPKKGVLEGQPMAPGEFRVVAVGLGDLDFALSAEGGDVGLFSPSGQGTVIHYGAVPEDFSVARVSDCCSGATCLGLVFGGTPGTTNDPGSQVREELVGAASTWKYWDQGTDPVGWVGVGFDDQGWLSGVGPLGYGDGWFATTIGYGVDPNLKYITTYFRHELEFVGDTLPRQLELGLLYDDGVVIYLNGNEVDRVGMPAGDISSATLATTSMGGAGEAARWVRTVDAWALKPGRNVLAVEVHQAAQSSSDLGFDLSVTGIW